MGKTNKKELVINVENNKQLDFMNKIKKKLNFISLQILLKQNSVHIILKGPRERINYAIQVIKRIQKEMKTNL
ncbi:MAG: hypothetical protein ACFFDN_03255 [Candidatus Hodarchaeota archaeon]